VVSNGMLVRLKIQKLILCIYSNVVVIIVKIIFIHSFLFYCLFYNHSFKTNPNTVTNFSKLFNYIAPASLFITFLRCAGSAVASGLVVPILIIGAAFGRICGLVIVDMTGELYLDPNYNWIDPGAFALIGAAAFFGGVSRLTISLTIIMMEITNDIRFLLPIMTSILVSKLAADQLTHSLYHALLGTLKK
jgi:H+/Cl- antiporter ClcA